MADCTNFVWFAKKLESNMWMSTYIQQIQEAFITQHNFQEDPERPGVPLNVPDGKYSIEIDGKVDTVEIKKGKIYCCNFS
jgi:hypothetical protein